MISKKVALAFLSVLVIGVVLLFASAQSQTAPTWIGNDISSTSGSVDAWKTVINSDAGYVSMLQFVESSAWVGSLWGIDYKGDWVQISPASASDADTTLSIDGATPYFTFPAVLLRVIVTHSGTATVWGE